MGAWLVGTLNTSADGWFRPSHSIGGALAGAILAVEAWKRRRGVTGSTGGAFVLPLSVGIAVGRFGCLFAGLPDETYGTSTNLPWAVDLGDGIGRHPVQLYESASMAVFALATILARRRGARWAEVNGFYAFVIAYAAQRFCWEILKPYPTLIGPLNLFQLLMIGMILYGFLWWRRSDDGSAAGDRSGAPGA